MHLPDGFLDTPTCVATTAAAAGALALSGWQMSRSRDAPSPRNMALVGAAVFAAQAGNFPLSNSTSGHLIGAVTATVLLGPWAAMIVVSAVLAVQCVAMGDGGITALGANILNMAVLGAALGAPVWMVRRRGVPAKHLAAASLAAGLCALPLGAAACAVELSASGTIGATETINAMLPLHVALGLAEGAFAASIALLATRHDTSLLIVHRGSEHRRADQLGRTAAWLGGIAAAAAALAIASSKLPDTLEAAAETLGFAPAATNVLPALLGEQQLSAWFAASSGEWLAAVTMATGTLVAFGAVWMSGRLFGAVGR